VNGFLNVYKPSGISSYDVIRRLKPYLGSTKVGHLGTLDPMAEGVLPLALGAATKLIEYVPGTKGYVAEMVLGGVSDTQDATGTINRRPSRLYYKEEIEEVLKGFSGYIMQIPPMYSALRLRGKRLYELARMGQNVERRPRMVRIYKLSLVAVTELRAEQRVRIYVECGPGTYIRTLCHDIGQALGCGAYLDFLVRVHSGPFQIHEALDIRVLSSRRAIEQRLLPVDYIFAGWPRVIVDDEVRAGIICGRSVEIGGGVRIEDTTPEGERIKAQLVLERTYPVYDENHNLLAVARACADERGAMILKPEKVLVKAGEVL